MAKNNKKFSKYRNGRNGKMKSKGRSYHPSQVIGKWTLQKYLGGGGNGEVWQCADDKKQIAAIKLLKRIHPKTYDRFRDETSVIQRNSDVEGIVTIIDAALPESLGGDVPYYVMPIGSPAEAVLKGKSIDHKIDAILSIARCLRQLHERKIYHRDIKPANLLYVNGNIILADFGLVDYPNKKEVSLKNEEIGPKWTMAPEMRRESSTADGAKADVYSLAKTLWIFLTDNRKGFDGQYSTGSIIELKKFYKETYTAPIDKLLIACTDNDPQMRPDISQFIDALEDWKVLNEDFHEMNLEQWFEIQTKLFPTGFPKRVIWENVDDIVNVLKVICSYDNLNHLFYPSGGGNDLVDVRLAGEEGYIELDFTTITIIKPKQLIFESFGYDPEWNYFRLEAAKLEPVFAEELEDGQESFQKKYKYESLSELYPGGYYPYNVLEDRDQYAEEYPIDEFSRQITRYLEGSFVIFNKRSPYNLTSATYDARHDKMSTDEFREYIQGSIDHAKELQGKRSLFDKFIDRVNRKRKPRDETYYAED